MHELCSDWHASYTGSIAPYSLSRGNPLKFTLFRNIHSWICAAQRLHARTSVTSYTSVNIYNFNSRLAHLYALWMEYISSLRTGIMAEYPVMSTSQGTYVRIEQTSEAIRVTYEICRAGAQGLELRTAGLGQCRAICLKILSVHLDSHLPPVCLFIFPFLDRAVFVFLFYFKQSLQLFSYDSLYFFLLSICFFCCSNQNDKKGSKVQTDICRLLCKSFLFHLKSLPTPLPDSENYVCRGLCQEDVPCQTVQLLAAGCFLDDIILEHFPAGIATGVERCISLRAVC